MKWTGGKCEYPIWQTWAFIAVVLFALFAPALVEWALKVIAR